MRSLRSIFIMMICLFTTSSFSQTTITCDSILQTSTCAGGDVIIPFHITGSFPFGNVFTAELSDNWGNWNTPVSVGTTMFTLAGNGLIFGTIPANAAFGFFYRVRITSSNPVDTSNDSPNPLFVTQIAQLNTIFANPGDSACPGDTITLFAVNPATAYSWSTGDTTQSIQVTTSGVYSVTTTDFLTCESTTSDTVVFDPSACTGFEEHDISNALKLFPVPADDQFTIEFDHSYGNGTHLELSDCLGRVVWDQQLITDSNGRQSFDVSALQPGTYFLTLYSGNDRAVKKVIVQ